LAGACARFARGDANGTKTNALCFTGFINFKTKREFGVIKRLIGDSCHIEPAKGNDEQNRHYCTKDNNFWEFGVPLTKGQRTDLEALVGTIKESKSIRSVAEKHPVEYIKYSRGIERLFQHLAPVERRNWKTEVIIYYGQSGTGKSKTAKEICEAREYNIYYKARSSWWCGYNGQEAVIFDDFYGWQKYDDLLRITDRYPLVLEVKGGHTEFLAKIIFFTSNKPIETWYSGSWYDSDAIGAFKRRVSTYEYWSRDGRGDVIREDLLIENEINEFLN